MRFFKTGPGEYGEGDTFIGIKVPNLHTVLREFPVIALGRSRIASEFTDPRRTALGIDDPRIASGEVRRCLPASRVRLYLRNTEIYQ